MSAYCCISSVLILVYMCPQRACGRSSAYIYSARIFFFCSISSVLILLYMSIYVSSDPKCSVTVEQPDKKPVALVALSRGKTAKYVATWSSSAGLIVWVWSLRPHTLVD